MNTDELDNLSDAQLSEIFAVEVAGVSHEAYYEAVYHGDDKHFSTDANAVLPWLEKTEWTAHQRGKLVTMALRLIKDKPSVFTTAQAPTFARAACIALIRAKRATSK